MHLILTVLLLLIATPAVWAAPKEYALDASQSRVTFGWVLGKDEVTGSMRVSQADLALDFANVGNSQVEVSVDVNSAEAGFPFASQALKGPKMLDAARFPQIRFASRKVRANGQGALIDGDITLRGVTRPMTFTAQIYRKRGSDPGDLSQLVIQLNGTLNRSEFGADGWADQVGDLVRLDILASIEEQD